MAWVFQAGRLQLGSRSRFGGHKLLHDTPDVTAQARVRRGESWKPSVLLAGCARRNRRGIMSPFFGIRRQLTSCTYTFVADVGSAKACRNAPCNFKATETFAMLPCRSNEERWGAMHNGCICLGLDPISTKNGVVVSKGLFVTVGSTCAHCPRDSCKTQRPQH